ncbi:MAG: ABC transporter ATP-binding protein [Anaerolineae bacterium]|nr:ABC transporter ATP-binding protein [Anaerolineae bacterium]
MTVSEFAVAQEWQSDRRGPGRWILSHTLRHKWAIVGVLIGALGNALLAAVMPVFSGRAIDAVMAMPPDVQGLAAAAIIVAVSQLLRGFGLQMMRNLFSETIGQRLERDIRHELYASLIGKSMSFHDSYPTGDLMARATNDVREINLLFNPGINLVVGSANFIFMPLFVAPTIHPHLVLVPLIYLLSYGFVVRDYLRQLQPMAEGVRRNFGEMNTVLAESIDGIETVKGAAQEAREMGRFRQAVDNWRVAYLGQAAVEARFIPLLLLGLLVTGGLLHSLLLFRDGQISIGGVVSFNQLLLLFTFPTWSAQFAYSRVASGVASARRILDLINAETELGENVGGYDAPLRGEVAFEAVTFCYRRPEDDDYCGVQEATLEDVSFRAEPGQTVAIVGQTGSGKSTISKLINRIYDVQRGRVLIDGVDVREWRLEALRRQISIIEQDIFLFSRSIADNIAFGCPHASAEDVVAAARAAQAHDFIMAMKDGYDTVIGERGVTLSGGQRQRLAIARAFLTDPAILILDDATSAIDSETEDRIQQAIEHVAANRTTFLITHRISQIRWADVIIVMRMGRVEAVGTHEELLQVSQAYRDIFSRYE